jgi:hypothetical protein
MIKNYFTTINRRGTPIQMATIICENCKKEFTISKVVADSGRKYCDEVCMRVGRGFTKI